MNMTVNQKSKPQFAICINTDDPDLLTPRMIYEVLPDIDFQQGLPPLTEI
jgi:hypothetical protein